MPGVRRSTIAVGAALLLSAAAACSEPTDQADDTTTVSVPQQPTATTPDPPPPPPTPTQDATCPYLDTGYVEQVNGQRVGGVRTSADTPHPACFFYRSDGNEQLRIQVLVGADPATARALVDREAPVDTSDPAQLPGGWDGGKEPTDTGSVFAVYNGGSAVVVVSNQQQTFKSGEVAEQVIAALSL